MKQGLLYAGTETRVYVSFDDGGSWQTLRGNMPVTPISDLVLKGDDLVVATNGRSFWILDDLPALRQLSAADAESEAILLQPGAALRDPHPVGGGRPGGEGKNYMLGLGYGGAFYEKAGPDGEVERVMLDCGENPPSGVVVHYYLKEKPEEATLTFLDAEDNEIRSFSSKKPDGEDSATTKTGNVKQGEPVVRAEAGMNRFTWDTRYPGSTKPEIEDVDVHGFDGPVAPPGAHTRCGSMLAAASQTESFEIHRNPEADATDEDLREQFDLLMRIRDKVSETYEAANRIASVRGQVDAWVARATEDSAKDAVTVAADELKGKLDAVDSEIVQRDTLGGVDRLSKPSKLDAKIREVAFVPASADYKPTKQAYEVFDDLSGRLDVQFEALQEIIDNDLPKFVDIIHELEIPAINPQSAGQG